MTLPESVRRVVVDVAADRLGLMAAEEVPASLRPFARFAPGRRRQVVLPIATALETDEGFRAAVAQGFRDNAPDLVAALEAGVTLPLADPVEVAAVAYLLRAPGWEERIAAVVAAEREEQDRQQAGARSAEAAAALQAAHGEAAAARAQVSALRADLDKARADVERERRRAREAAERARVAEASLAGLQASLADDRTLVEADLLAARAEAQQLRERLDEAEAALERVRRDTRDAREAADLRRWLLLDTLSRSVTGLRDELSPAPPTRRPADLVEAGGPSVDTGPTIAPDDPASVDLLLTLPNAHLVVDGYNVTKTGYPDLTLEDQRSRLVAGLAGLAARTGAEVTCVFDGAEVPVRVPAAASRRVRVRFSPPGQIADELIRRLVSAEPSGRPVTVCSADRELVDGVRRSGARVVTPTALLARLDRA